jgi:hypothetical protein
VVVGWWWWWWWWWGSGGDGGTVPPCWSRGRTTLSASTAPYCLFVQAQKRCERFLNRTRNHMHPMLSRVLRRRPPRLTFEFADPKVSESVRDDDCAIDSLLCAYRFCSSCAVCSVGVELVCLSVCLCVSVCLSVCLSVCQSICQSVGLSGCVGLSVCVWWRGCLRSVTVRVPRPPVLRQEKEETRTILEALRSLEADMGIDRSR